MSQSSKKRRGEIQRALFKVLLEYPDGIRAKDAIARTESQLTLTEWEQSEYPNRPGIRRFDKIVRFLTISPVKAGWLSKEKGMWTIAKAGEEAYRKLVDPEQFFTESTRLYRAWKADQPIDEEGISADEEESTILEEAEETAWAEISDYLAQLNPYDFQDLVSGLLRGMGYHVAWVSPPGPDKGIDILAYEDALGFCVPRIKVQVKRTPESKVTAQALRAFMSTLGEQDVGLFVASGGFTKDAEKEAREQEKRRLRLIDLEELFDLWVQHYNSIPEAQRSLLPLRSIWFLAPEV